MRYTNRLLLLLLLLLLGMNDTDAFVLGVYHRGLPKAIV